MPVANELVIYNASDTDNWQVTVPRYSMLVLVFLQRVLGQCFSDSWLNLIWGF